MKESELDLKIHRHRWVAITPTISKCKFCEIYRMKIPKSNKMVKDIFGEFHLRWRYSTLYAKEISSGAKLCIRQN